jgi:hypothetical protein
MERDPALLRGRLGVNMFMPPPGGQDVMSVKMDLSSLESPPIRNSSMSRDCGCAPAESVAMALRIRPLYRRDSSRTIIPGEG